MAVDKFYADYLILAEKICQDEGAECVTLRTVHFDDGGGVTARIQRADGGEALSVIVTSWIAEAWAVLGEEEFVPCVLIPEAEGGRQVFMNWKVCEVNHMGD